MSAVSSPHQGSGYLGSPASTITLSHPGWTSNLVTGMHRMWRENVLCDTNIKCLNNETLTAHSLMLSAASPTLKDFFMKARQGLYTLKMDTVPANLWRHLLEFLYCGSLQIPVSQLFPLYNIVKKLHIDTLERLCESYIESTITGNSRQPGIPSLANITSPAMHIQSLESSGASVTVAPPSGGSQQQPAMLSLGQQSQHQVKQEIVETDANMRGRASTSPESGVYSAAADDTNMLSFPGALGDQDWNQVRVHDIRSVTPEPREQKTDGQYVGNGELNKNNHSSAGLASNTLSLFSCVGCKRAFKTKHGLRLHQYKCKKVPASATTAAKKYIKAGKMFKCKICSRTFGCYTSIWCHLKFHTGEGMVTCDLCHGQFPTKQLLERHIKYQHSKPNTVFTPDSAVMSKFKSALVPLTPLVSCRICNRQFATNVELKKHEQKDHDDKSMLFMCTNCGRKFTSEVIYKIHMDTHREQELRTCKVCKQVFKSAKAAQSHAMIHKSEDGEDLRTEKISSSDEKSSTLAPTLETIDITETLPQYSEIKDSEKADIAPKKRGSSKCKYCNKNFKKQGMLAIHMKVHTRQSPHICRVCCRQFAHRGALTRHKTICVQYNSTLSLGPLPDRTEESGEPAAAAAAEVGGENKNLKNESMPMDLSKRTDDARQMNAVSVKGTDQPLDRPVPTYACSHCHVVFSDRKQLYYHTCRDSEGKIIEKLYTCKVCSKQFSKSTEYRQHSRIHRISQPRKYDCTDCNKKFSSKGARETHLYSHRRKQFRCDQCSKDFRYEIVLAQHVHTVHNGPMPYACMVCGARFPLKPALTEHMLTHEGAHPYRCDICGVEFNRDRMLRKHMSMVHNVSPLNAPRVEDEGSVTSLHPGKSGNIPPHPQTAATNEMNNARMLTPNV